MIKSKSPYVYVNPRGTSECPVCGDYLRISKCETCGVDYDRLTITLRLCGYPFTVSADCFEG
ncbi:MAG: hypothetical protein QXY52_05250 [Conexivisphaerales archaeon]